MTDTTQLTVIAEESGLEKSKAEILLTQFTGYFAEAKEVAQGYKDIIVKDENDIETMAEAKTKRKALRDIRVEAEKTRKALKEQSLREGRAIDGISNVIKALIVPAEEHLLAQEKYAERLKAETDSRIESERNIELSKYVEDADVYSLHPDNLSDEAFSKLLENSKFAYEAKKKAEEQAEKERVENEKKQEIYMSRKLSLSMYSDFVDFELLTLDTTEDQYKSILKKAEDDKEEYLAEQEKIKAENMKLQAEKEKAEKSQREAEEKLRKEQEKIRKEQLAQQLKEKEAKQLEEARIKAEEEEKKRLLLAPDKDKLIKFVNDIQNVTRPHLETMEAGEILDEANDLIIKAVDLLRIGANKL